MNRPIVAGIDLGTTFSALAAWDPGQERPVVYRNAEGELLTPSAVAFVDGEGVVGGAAKHMAPAYHDRTATGFKRLMGVLTPDGKPVDILVVDGKVYTAEALSAMVLRKVAADAAVQIGAEITQVVITVPAYFGNSARQATRNAASIAGLECVRIINEPTAAALGVGLRRDFKGRLVVFDYGGGTLDASVVKVENHSFTVLATDGDRQLGGEDQTNEIAQMVLDETEAQHGFLPNPDEDAAAILDLFDKAERAKRDLTSRKKTVVSFSARGKEVRLEITRQAFEERIRPMVVRAVEIAERAIEAAKVSRDELTLIMVGGATRVPLVGSLVSERLGLEPMETEVEKDLAVAMGAAIAAVSDGLSDGESEGGLARVVFKDVTAHGLGVQIVDEETGNRVLSTIIPANTQVPVKRSRAYALEKDVQTTARICVIQGPDGAAADGPGVELIGEVVLRGLPVKLPREDRIEVTFGYDRDGVVVVDAVDKVSGKATHGRLERRRGMTDAEIEEARREVEGILSE